jgi:hypothetical protein
VNTKPSSIIWLLLGLAAVFIIFWGVRSMAFILAPLAMAMVITIAMIPLPGWLKQRKVPGGLAITQPMPRSSRRLHQPPRHRPQRRRLWIRPRVRSRAWSARKWSTSLRPRS